MRNTIFRTLAGAGCCGGSGGSTWNVILVFTAPPVFLHVIVNVVRGNVTGVAGRLSCTAERLLSCIDCESSMGRRFAPRFAATDRFASCCCCCCCCIRERSDSGMRPEIIPEMAEYNVKCRSYTFLASLSRIRITWKLCIQSHRYTWLPYTALPLYAPIYICTASRCTFIIRVCIHPHASQQ